MKTSKHTHIAKQVLLGEFDRVTPLPASSLIRQLGWQSHPLCQQAAEKLRRDFIAAYPPKGNFRDA